MSTILHHSKIYGDRVYWPVSFYMFDQKYTFSCIHEEILNVGEDYSKPLADNPDQPLQNHYKDTKSNYSASPDRLLGPFSEN